MGGATLSTPTCAFLSSVSATDIAREGLKLVDRRVLRGFHVFAEKEFSADIDDEHGGAQLELQIQSNYIKGRMQSVL